MMSGPVSWRGVMLDPRSADMMAEVCRLVPHVPIDPTQGSYSGSVSASAGTHAGGGAIDIAAEHLSQSQRDELCLAMRRVGWAAWVRNPSESDWPWHLHGIAVGCHDLSPAASDQVHDYLTGRNGLASNGPDEGPRDFDHVGITWEQYCARETATEEDDEMKPWAINVGTGWQLSDLATYTTHVLDFGVITEGLALGAFQEFANGSPVGKGWVDHINRLPRADAPAA